MLGLAIKVSLYKLRVGDYLPAVKATVVQTQPIRVGEGKGTITTVSYGLSGGLYLLAHNAAILYRDKDDRLRVVLNRERLPSMVEVIRPPLVSD